MIDQILSPRLVAPGAAAIYDHIGGEKMHILLSGQQTGGTLALCIDEVPPNAGPPLHIHQHEDETFYILEGELIVQVNEEQLKVSAGCAAFLPRGVPHTFVNMGAATTRVLVMLTPGGLERFFAEVEPLVTQMEPDMTAVLGMAARYGIEAVGPPLAGQVNGIPGADDHPQVARPHSAMTFGEPGGETMQILLNGEQTAGQLALLVGEFPPGSGTSLHRHQYEDELIYMLEGTLDLQLGQEMATAVAGAAAFLPRGVAHDFHNHSEQMVKALAFITPGGFENYFTEFFTLLTQGVLNEETQRTLAQKYGLENNP
jgi:quercetin dioxygenase-like cupin family protein